MQRPFDGPGRSVDVPMSLWHQSEDRQRAARKSQPVELSIPRCQFWEANDTSGRWSGRSRRGPDDMYSLSARSYAASRYAPKCSADLQLRRTLVPAADTQRAERGQSVLLFQRQLALTVFSTCSSWPSVSRALTVRPPCLSACCQSTRTKHRQAKQLLKKKVRPHAGSAPKATKTRNV